MYAMSGETDKRLTWSSAEALKSACVRAGLRGAVAVALGPNTAQATNTKTNNTRKNKFWIAVRVRLIYAITIFQD